MGTGNIPYEPRLNMLSADGKNIRYDPQKLAWIGTPVREPQVSYVWHATPVKTWQDMRTHKVRFGATAASGDNAIFPAMANKLLNLKSEVITGYRGVAEILLAMERGELEANNSAYSTLGVSKPDWRRDNKVRYVMQFGVERIAELKDVPTLYELVDNPDDKQMLRFFFLKFEMHRPIYAPPNIPKDRLAALRTAFDRTMKDPDFLAIADKMGLMIRPLDGDGVAKLVDEIMTTPQPLSTSFGARSRMRASSKKLARNNRKGEIDEASHIHACRRTRVSCCACVGEPGDRALLPGQASTGDRRLGRWRRIRRLRPAGCAPSRTLHSGRAGVCCSEHAGRGRCRGRELRGQCGAKGWHRDRRDAARGASSS